MTVPQPPGDYGPLLYPTNTEGTAGLTLDFTVVHPVGRRGTEYAYDEHALHKAYHAKVTKRHEWLQAQNYWFVRRDRRHHRRAPPGVPAAPLNSTPSRTP